MSSGKLICYFVVLCAVTKRFLQRKFAHLVNPKGAVYARSGSEALQRIQEEVFDLILLDMHMPGPSGPHGLDCAQIIREGQLPGSAAQANRTSRIVAVTSDCEPWQRDQYRSALLDGLIPKPVCQAHLGTFLEIVQQETQSVQRSEGFPGLARCARTNCHHCHHCHHCHQLWSLPLDVPFSMKRNRTRVSLLC